MVSVHAQCIMGDECGRDPGNLQRRLGRNAAEMEKLSFLQRRVVKLRMTVREKLRRAHPPEEGLFLSELE